MVAAQAGGGHGADDVVDPLGRETLTAMSWMSGLPARLASGGAFDHWLGCTGGSVEGGIEELEEVRLSC